MDNMSNEKYMTVFQYRNTFAALCGAFGTDYTKDNAHQNTASANKMCTEKLFLYFMEATVCNSKITAW